MGAAVVVASALAAAFTGAVAIPAAGAAKSGGAINGQIAFQSSRYFESGYTDNVWVMQPDGSDQAVRTQRSQANTGGPPWWPNESRIAFQSDARR